MKVRVERLRAAIAHDRRAAEAKLAELAGVAPEAILVDVGARAVTAIALHSLYGAIEMILERVARTLEGDVPIGANWHQALLEEMALELQGIRPAVLSAPSLRLLRDLLGFRHFFRHAYAVDLDSEKLCTLRDKALRLAPLLAADLDRLDALLVALSNTESPRPR